MNLRAIGFALLLLAATEAAGAGSLALHYADGRLSVRAEQIPLKTILQRVARQAGIRLYMAAGFGDELASWSCSDLRLEEALLQLVRPNNLMILYGPEQGSGPSIAGLYVSPASQPAKAAQVENSAPEGEAATRNEVQRLSNLILGTGDMAQRRQAIADLAAMRSPDAIHGLEQALGAEEPELRGEAVQALGEVYGDAPPLALGQMVLGDRDARVRVAAVRALAGLGGESAKLFIEPALKDRDETVQETARQALGEFAGR